MSNIIADLLDYLGVKHTNYFVNKLYHEHPHNEDMYGLKDMLRSYNIESVGVDIKDKDETNMYFPSIYHTADQFILALECNDKKVSYIMNGKVNTDSLHVFKEMWDGKALYITSADNAEENGYLHNLAIEWVNKLSWSSFVICPLILMLILFKQHSLYNMNNLPLLILGIIGCVLCYFLLQKKIEEKSIVSDKFCSILTENGCDAVLTSKSSTILYIYSWSEIGMAYFFTSILLFSFMPQLLPGLALVNYIAMIYGVWSVWYQATKVKKWCTLCLSVQLTIWSLGIYYTILLYNNNIIFSNVIIPSLVVVISMVLAIVSIHFIVKSYIDNYLLMTTVKKLKKFQVDNDVLEAKYHKETAYPDASNVSSVFFGNINAPYQTTILINPQCSHCRDLFEKVEPLLRKKSKKIGVRFILLSFRPQNDYACKLFIAAKQQMSEEKALELYSLWFGDRSNQNETFAQSCGLELNHEKVVSEYELHKRWTKENNLHSTPFVLINNHTLPGMYEIEDIEKMDEI